MAQFIIIHVDNVIPDLETTIIVSYRWVSISGTTSYSGDGEASYSSSTLSSVINQNISNICVAESDIAGITIGLLDRRIIMSGLL